MIVDPRAGHGPGIGGSKEASQVGVALRAGHPVYFVAFHPEPEPGQTIADIAWAEAQFLRKVQELHPEAEGKPVVVGNCQAGWAIMMLAAAAPDLVGLISIAGSPLSYWAGVEGKNPMRYMGGLLGGTWLTSLCGDLGNGKFDGAYLVENFENLNPANTLWTKQYNLYSKIDTEEPRYLGFEKWWGGYFLTTKEEMRAIVDELFVGNKLTKGTILTADRRAIDLRNIRAPIVVIASWGDNITPPQQALYWIADLYESVAEIVANEQTIIYTLDERIGHLGIFVSAKVAAKQHAELVNTLDLIEVLPPGLYEMILEEKTAEAVGADLLPGQYLVRFEGRTIDDILALGDGREHEQAFETVARISEINEGLYDTFLSPWVRLWSNEASAEALRLMHPLRLQRFLLSDLNPAMWPVRLMAEAVRKDRRPAAADNAARAPSMRSRSRSSRRSTSTGRSGSGCRSSPSRRSTTRPWSRRSPACGRPMPTPARRAPATHTPSSCSRPRSRRSRRVRSGAACRSRAAHHARGGSGREDVRCARLPARPADQAGGCGAAPHTARAHEGRGQGAGVHAALRPRTRAGRSALDAADRGRAPQGLGHRAAHRLRGWRDPAGRRRRSCQDRGDPGPRGRRQRADGAASGAGTPDRSRGEMRKEQRPIDIAPPSKPAREYRVYPALIERCAELEPVTTAVAHPCDECRSRLRSTPRTAI